MNFSNFGENRKLAERLERAVGEDRVSHAYLFEAPGTVDKLDFAKCFIKGILCPDRRGENCGKCSICSKIDHDNHEDIVYIGKEGLSIKDASIIDLQDKLKIKPIGQRTVAVISDADTMTSRAQNRLLKTLEEPPAGTVIILLSENMENLAQTILSRCVKFRLSASEDVNSTNLHDKAELAVKMSLDKKPFYEIRNALGKSISDKDEIEIIFDEMEEVYRNLIMTKSHGIPLYKFDEIYNGIHAVEEARKQVKSGTSATYAMKNLLLGLGSYSERK